MSSTSTIPLDELLRRLPTPEAIRERLDQLERDRLALLALLRAAHRARKTTPSTAARRQEASR